VSQITTELSGGAFSVRSNDWLYFLLRFATCPNRNFFIATVSIQYLNIHFSSYIALFDPKKGDMGTILSQNKQTILLISSTYHGLTPYYCTPYYCTLSSRTGFMF